MIWRTVIRIPGLLIDAADAATETPQHVRDLQRTLANTLEPLSRSVRQIGAVLPTIASDLQRVRETIEPQQERVRAIEETIGRLDTRVAELQRTLTRLRDDVEDAAEHLPDPDAPGPLARARDTLLGNS